MEMWLNRALEMENRGRDFYERVAASNLEAAVRDFFKFLADQEGVHQRIIRDLYSQQSHNAAPAEPQAAGGPSLNKIFLTLNKSRPAADTDLIQAIEHAQTLETETAAFYRDAQAWTDDVAAKEFLRTLSGEENDHYQALADLKLFYTNPEAWAEKMAAIHLDGA
jgi:rubrerythrin